MTTTGTDELKRRARAAIEAWGSRLIDLSHDLHAHPELAWNEHRSARACAALVTEAGMATTVGVHGLPTAFRGDAGGDGPLIAVCCEYDALPDLGHASAHNVIAAAGVGAAIGLAAVADLAPLRVRVLGTPAEEDTGGKIDLLADGAFDGATAALMVHAYALDVGEFVSYSADDLTVRCASRADLPAIVAAIECGACHGARRCRRARPGSGRRCRGPGRGAHGHHRPARCRPCSSSPRRWRRCRGRRSPAPATAATARSTVTAHSLPRTGATPRRWDADRSTPGAPMPAPTWATSRW
ncbi:MAG: hypothetical protein QM733_09870 [Ilumatobacteraceae bacterium]